MSAKPEKQPYIREIGAEFLKEITKGFSRGNHIAILGPPESAKSLLLDELANEAHGRKIVRLFWNSKMDGETLLREVSGQLGIEVEQGKHRSLGGTLADALLRAGKEEKLGVFVQDIVGFPAPIARALLNALLRTKKDLENENGIAAVITGGGDFKDLAFSKDSPYAPHLTRYVSISLSRDWAAAFYMRIRKLQLGEAIPTSIQAEELKEVDDQEAFDYLYEQTGGNPHFIQEIVLNSIKHSYKEGHLSLRKVLNLSIMVKIVKRYLKLCMESDFIVRGLVRSVEYNDTAFKQLTQLLKEDTSLSVLGNDPSFLEVAGIARRDISGTLFFSCPLWRNFLKNFLREREIADVYAWQGSWDEVWQQYDQNVATTQRDRPISGSSRFRLRAVVAAWRKKLQISASEGTQPVTAHFKNGIKYLYGFDCTEFVPYKKKGSSILPLDKCEHLTLLLGQLKQKPFASTEKVDYFYFADNHIIVAVGKKRLPGPSEEYPILLLKKEGAERVIESKEREELQTDIEQFFSFTTLPVNTITTNA